MENAKQNEIAVGIDLGTTNSAIAWLDDLGRPQTLANAEGDKVTCSASSAIDRLLSSCRELNRR